MVLSASYQSPGEEVPWFSFRSMCFHTEAPEGQTADAYTWVL
jgi:hypothetical protein